MDCAAQRCHLHSKFPLWSVQQEFRKTIRGLIVAGYGYNGISDSRRTSENDRKLRACVRARGYHRRFSPTTAQRTQIKCIVFFHSSSVLETVWLKIVARSSTYARLKLSDRSEPDH